MGREIKRVPVAWDWPLEQIWEGYLNPLGGFPPCPDCSYEEADTLMDKAFPQSNKRGSGLTPEAYAVSQTFYAHQIDSAMGAGAREYAGGWGVSPGARRLAWHDKIGQAEVDNLLAHDRLRTWIDGKWEALPLTAEEVNAAQRSGSGLGDRSHDGVNRWILIEFRCEMLGIEQHCKTCGGSGDIATDDERDAYENWEPTEPPVGDGWQVWETVSEGSPITPVFPTAKALVDYLSTYGTTWDQKPSAFGREKGPWRREAAEEFVKTGWAMSFMAVNDGSGTKVFDGARDADRIASSTKKDEK